MAAKKKTEEVTTEEVAAPVAVSYVVAAGKSIMTKAGVKAAGTKVEAKHFHNGEEHLADLLEKGFLEKV